MDFMNMDFMNMEYEDNNTIVSELTEQTENYSSLNIDELTLQIKETLNKLNIDGLKEKCKEHSISGISKLNKQELVNLLFTEFTKFLSMVKEAKVNDLRMICKYYKLKGNNATSKKVLLKRILSHCSTTLKFTMDFTEKPEKLETPEKKTTEKTEKMKKTMETIDDASTVSTNTLEMLEKQRKDIEEKMKIELEKQKKIDDEIKRVAEEKERKLLEEEKQALEEQRKKEKEEIKRKKQTIPKQIRTIVWNHYIGDDIIKHKCLSCKKVSITNTNFDVGHVISEMNGGTHEITNLRPICGACNHSMGTENMVDFVIKYGLCIG